MDDQAYEKLVKTLMYNGKCEHCLKTAKKMFKCSRCLITRYCSTECQKSHWSTHKLKCKVINVDDPLVKLSKITPYTILVYATMYYFANKSDLEQSRILQFDIPNDNFFDLLSGKITSPVPGLDPVITSIACDTASGSEKYTFVRIKYKDKVRTAYFPVENIRYLVENGIPTDPTKFREKIGQALDGFQSD